MGYVEADALDGQVTACHSAIDRAGHDLVPRLAVSPLLDIDQVPKDRPDDECILGHRPSAGVTTATLTM